MAMSGGPWRLPGRRRSPPRATFAQVLATGRQPRDRRTSEYCCDAAHHDEVDVVTSEDVKRFFEPGGLAKYRSAPRGYQRSLATRPGAPRGRARASSVSA